MSQAYLKIENLKVNYKTFEGTKPVLNIEDLEVQKGAAYGIIGESGTGKTILALSILRLIESPPGEIASGRILLEGRNLLELKDKVMQREIRGKKISMIFQDPMSTLNPVFTVGRQLENVLMENQKLNRKAARIKAVEMIDMVKLADAERVMTKYPHELSGGQRQRVIIALALSCGAEMIIADEPTRNLDVTIQAGILKLLKEIQRELKVTVLFIANNPGLVSAICEKVAILYQGEIIEEGTTREVLRTPRHPYTHTLLNAVPKEKDEAVDVGKLAVSDSGVEMADGCSYYARCPHRTEECLERQTAQEVNPDHHVRCHRWEEIS